MATTCGPRERKNMKTKAILSVIGLTLLGLSPTTWAAGHGGGGGGFGGGGFSGGHSGGGGGSGRGHFGGGVPHFASGVPRFSGGIGMSRIRPYVFSGADRGLNRPAALSVANRGAMPA